MAQDDIWPGEYKPTLDGLLSDKQPVSPPFEVEIGARLFTLALRTLSRAQIARLQLDARDWARKEVQRVGLPVEDVDSPYVSDLVANELELRILWASAVNPDSEGGRGPAFTIDKLRDTITPPQQQILNEKWYTWQTKSAPESLTEEEIETMIQAAKNNDFFFLLKFGTGKLFLLMRSMVDLLEISDRNKSSDGLSLTQQLANMKKSTKQDRSALIQQLSSNLSPLPSEAKKPEDK